MNNNYENDNFWIGFMVGAVVPVLAYLAIAEVFSQLTSLGIMDNISISTGGQRERTTLLLAIACNIIPSQFWVKRKSNYAIKGVVLATLIYAGAWLFKYYELLMQNY